jgi:hypothetical protein
MAKISGWFLLLLPLATMASIDAEDPRLADGEQARTEGVYALLRAMRARSKAADSGPVERRDSADSANCAPDCRLMEHPPDLP